MEKKTFGEIWKIRYINGKKVRFEANSRELHELATLKAAAVPVAISEEEWAEMLDGVPADKVERARARLLDAHNKNEADRIAQVNVEIAKLEKHIEHIRTVGVCAESADNYHWHTTHRG
jgi:hypothetical protein